MPIRRIEEKDVSNPDRWCRSNDHNPPQNIYLHNGLYEHECPSCGKKTRFRVANPTL